MEDLRNNDEFKYYKIMWANADELIWDVISEKAIPVESKVYKDVNKIIDLSLWQADFSNKYFNWLYDDDTTIYEIDAEVNQRIILALPKINSLLKKLKIKLFYWFDVDRDKNYNFVWSHSPISGNSLQKRNFKSKEVLVSSSEYLIFPACPPLPPE